MIRFFQFYNVLQLTNHLMPTYRTTHTKEFPYLQYNTCCLHCLHYGYVSLPIFCLKDTVMKSYYCLFTFIIKIFDYFLSSCITNVLRMNMTNTKNSVNECTQFLISALIKLIIKLSVSSLFTFDEKKRVVIRVSAMRLSVILKPMDRFRYWMCI